MNMKTEIRLLRSNICTGFGPMAIGTRVQRTGPFLSGAIDAIEKYDFTTGKVPGQGFIVAPELVEYVSAGVGRRSEDPNHYVCREHRGIVSAYLKREYAAVATGCALVVYTKDAYLADPDVTTEEAALVTAEGATHVLVAVLAFAGPDSPLPTYRLVWNLAGGNREALVWTADEIRAKAKAAIDYDNLWSTVAD
jgi:hypothetical protein